MSINHLIDGNGLPQASRISIECTNVKSETLEVAQGCFDELCTITKVSDEELTLNPNTLGNNGNPLVSKADGNVDFAQELEVTTVTTTVKNDLICEQVVQANELKSVCGDSSVISLKTPNLGNAGYFLATDGVGNTYWKIDGAGPSGIQQNQVPAPTTALNRVPLYNSNDGLTVKESNLQYTGLGWNFSGERLNNIQNVQTSQLSTIAPATAVEVQSDLEMTGPDKRILAVESISGQNEVNKLNLANGSLTGLNNASLNAKSGVVLLQINDVDKLIIDDLQTNIDNKLICNDIDGDVAGNLNVGSFTLEQETIYSNNDNYLRLNPSSVALVSDGTIDINPVTQTNIRVNNDSKVEITSTQTVIKNTLKADTIEGELLQNTLNIGELLLENTSIFSDPNNYLRLAGGSVALASDGGIDINPATNLTIRVAGFPKLSIDAAQTQSAQLINMNGNKIISLGLATGSADAVSKGYIDNEKGASSGICPLDSGVKIPSQYLPDLAITQVYVVADDAARDAITEVQAGDVAIVASPANNWIWTGPEGSPTASGSPPNYDWVKLVVPTGTVTSVNSFTGTVTLETDNIPETVATLNNRYYTAAREAELFKKDGRVSMEGNLESDGYNILMGGGNLSSANTVQTLNISSSGSSVNVNDDLVMGGNSIFMTSGNILDC